MSYCFYAMLSYLACICTPIPDPLPSGVPMPRAPTSRVLRSGGGEGEGEDEDELRRCSTRPGEPFFVISTRCRPPRVAERGY